MIPATNLRTGMALIENNSVYLVTECEHVKPGKGTAFSRIRMKHIRSGSVIDKTFKAADKVDDVRVERRDSQYQYNDGHMYYMMDLETYDQVPVEKDMLGAETLFIKDSMTISLLTTDQGVVGIEMPNFVELEVTETEPGVRGDTATGGTKPATLESGGVVQVPLFVNIGDVLKIDTRTKAYVERV
ncbi:MAG: elongation factor P [Candidatus Latescibacteria bacterium]|jgi:elongation factor P|nr:elongation factor P [Candidatus Latescibacterota bacterium]